MALPVVHFEVIGKHPEQLRRYFGALFGWEYDTSGTVADAVSDPNDYGFVYGDFRRVHRSGLIAAEYRAAEWRHKEVELAAHDLLQLLDSQRA